MKDFLKKILPGPILSLLRALCQLPYRIYESYLIKTQPYLHRKALRKLRKKDGPINVVFFAIFKSVWKYDRLYWLMEQNPQFHPVVLVCPRVNFGRVEMLNTLHECYSDFKARGYRVICSYDEKTDTYIDARSLNPDIIFYTNPYQGLIDDRYYITHFRDVLSCYVNYGYSIVKHKWGNGLVFHKLLWRHFCEAEKMRDFIISVQGKDNPNCVVTGYPMYDDFLFGSNTGKDWKQANLKRVIWAPHHTIEKANLDEMIQFSTFFQYAEFMKQLAVKYADRIQFVFKPHALLRPKLYEHPDWGQKKTDEYYDFWRNGVNTNYVSGDYVDLFKSSDALIHDCGSFTVEYLYTQKPVMYLSAFDHLSQLNDIAKQAYESHYIARNENDVERFIIKVVLGGHDPMYEKRKVFYDEILMPPNNKQVAENIIDNIASVIFN